MSTDDELLDLLEVALVTPVREPPPSAVAALRAAAVAPSAAAAAPLRPRRRRLAATAMTVAAAIAGFGGAQVVDQLRAGPEAGVVEFAIRLRSDDGSRSAGIEGTRVGTGRIVHLTSDELPILPMGEFYEVWFVGPGDTPAAPNRISAGTFHPDAQGRTDVELTAAVDPQILPSVEITAEPGDGDPRPSGRAALRAPVVVQG